MSDYILLLTTVATALLSGYFAYRGTRTTDKTDRLSQAAGLYSDYADKQEKRAEKLEVAVKELQANQREAAKQQVKTEQRLSDLEDENEEYKTLISEVIRWITELLDWEAHGYPEPAPRMTLTMILSHLTSTSGQSSHRYGRSETQKRRSWRGNP